MQTMISRNAKNRQRAKAKREEIRLALEKKYGRTILKREEAKALGLKVSDDVPEEVYQLMNLYPQSRTRRPSVEFIPIPYEERPERPPRRKSKE